jgi:hypothetical protein
MYFLTFSKKSVSAPELQRQPGHKRYQPIWELFNKLRDVTGKPLCYALREQFVQTVYLIFIALLLIDCTFVEFQTLFVTRLLPFRHLAFRFPQLSIGYGF